jgi:hypothetical protein
LWDAVKLDLLAALETGHEKNMSVAFSPDEKRMASGAWDGSLRSGTPKPERRFGNYHVRRSPRRMALA